jgi:hypothetical protein
MNSNTDVPQWTRRWLFDMPRPRRLLRAEWREADQEAECRVSEIRQVRMPKYAREHPCGPVVNVNLLRGDAPVRVHCTPSERGAPLLYHRQGQSACELSLH